MELSCFCISHKDVRAPEPDEASSSMELDAALQELGMLSRITDSRKNYLEEKKTKKQRSSNSLSSAPLCVVQMNSKFITKFENLIKPTTNSQSRSDSEELIVESEEFEPRRCRFLGKMSPRYFRKMARDKPYNVGHRNRPCIPAAAEDKSSPPNVSRQDSGNKSNPSSPSKSQNSPPGSSIVRSRSLDDLEIAKVEDAKEDCYGCYARSDIETVSQRISKLHVS